MRRKTPLRLIPLLALIVANSLPIIGVFYWQWTPIDVVFLYWAESAVVGMYGILKILVSGIAIQRLKLSLWLSLFFIVHFGISMTVHFFGLREIFKGVDPNFAIIYPAVFAFFMSHGISFVKNFLMGKEYYQSTQAMGAGMFAPYKRVFVTHFFIFFGAGLTAIFSTSAIGVLPLIFIKIGFDMFFHVKSHQMPKT